MKFSVIRTLYHYDTVAAAWVTGAKAELACIQASEVSVCRAEYSHRRPRMVTENLDPLASHILPRFAASDDPLAHDC